MLSSRRLIVRAKRFLHQSVACRTAAMAQGQVTVNGVKLHYEIRGRGSHPIICIPGQEVKFSEQKIGMIFLFLY